MNGETDTQRRVVRTTEIAERVLGNPVLAREWLNAENQCLGGVTPLSLLDSQEGEQLVARTLMQIEHGIVC